MTTFKSDRAVPISFESLEDPKFQHDYNRPSTSAKFSNKSFNTLGSKSGCQIKESNFGTKGDDGLQSPDWFDKSADDLFNTFNKIHSLNRFEESDAWYGDMRRRFDERRRQWDGDIRRMREDIFAPLPQTSLSNLPSRVSSPPSKDPVSTQYERGEDGNVHFIARFEVHDIEPTDLKVSICNGQVIVSTCVEQRQGSTTTTKKFTRSVDLPKGSIEEQITAALNPNDILIIDCPLHPPRVSYISNVSRDTVPNSNISYSQEYDHPSSLRVSGGANTRGVSYSNSTPLTNWKSYSQMQSKFHIEIPIGLEYTPEDIQIRTLNQRIYVTAKHEERSSNRNTFREFSKEYDVPTDIDLESITARLKEGVLHLEGKPLI